jgi:GT2 family glycosyltransferase
MIVIKIIGGLGNQISQYAFGLACARKLGVELKLDISGFASYTLHAFGLHQFTLHADIATPDEVAEARSVGVITETRLRFNAALISRLRDGVYLDGYWSDFLYLKGILPELRAQFHPATELQPSTQQLLKVVGSTESVSLHVRRGDYVSNQNCVVMPLEYYEDAIRETVHRFPASHFYVFSDDMDWVEDHLKIAAPHTWVRGNDASRNLEDFELMRHCRHHIVANSTFSTWAALLDDKVGLVIAPQQFFRPDDPWMLQTFGQVEQPVWNPAWLVMPVRMPAPEPLNFSQIAGGFAGKRRMRIGVWNYYEELTTDGYLFRHQNASIGHDLLKPWVDLHWYGQSNGLDFVTLDQTAGPKELDAIVFMDRPRQENPRIAELLALDIPKYLCIFETEVIKPDNWEPEFHRQMDRIFTWSDAHVDNRRYFKFNFAIDPVCSYDIEVLKTAFAQRKLCTMIAGAKASQHPNELYSARVQTIRSMEAHAPDEFDLYGVGWDASSFPSYRGPVQNKLATLAHYRFAICYENAQNYPGYITEKILDCLRAGVVPIYWGAPNIERWISTGCFIDRRKFANDQALLEHLQEMDQPIYNAYLDRIRDFLASPAAYPFSIECQITTLTAYLARDIKNRRADAPAMSVVIPSYNYGPYLHLAIGSALTQEVAGLEVLVLDNASTDETPTAVSSFLSDPRFRYMRNSRNIGGITNWRNAEMLASGELFTILSADDFLLPGQLGRMQAVLHANPDTALGYCPCMAVNERSQPTGVLSHAGHPPATCIGTRDEWLHLLHFDCFITPSAAVIRRTAIDQVGRMDPSLHGAIDWDLWVRIAQAGLKFAFFQDPLVCYRLHAEQDTNRLNANTGLLEDHIRILEKAIEAGHLNRLRNHAQGVLALIQVKYQRFPPDAVQHLRGRYERVLNAVLGTPQTN